MKTEQQNKSGKKKKIILFSLGAASTTILGYLGWGYWKKKKAQKEEESSSENISSQVKQPPKELDFKIASVRAVQRTDDFPLQKGSKGIKVQQLQQALMDKYGKTILPKYGADGDFGSETQGALQKLNLATIIDENTFNVITKGNTINAKEVAIAIYKAIIANNFEQVLFTLKGLKSTQDYASVSEQFKQYRLNGVRQTLVNGLLSSFWDESQKEKLRAEFSRMGLKFDGDKWSLSGLGLPKEMLMTTVPTIVWKNAKEGIKVPARMVLGKAVGWNGQYLLFENNKKTFLVKRSTIRFI